MKSLIVGLTAVLLSLPISAQTLPLQGCFRKTYNVDPSGHIAKIPAGVDWIFSFDQEQSQLKVTAEGRPEYCQISFSLEALQGSAKKFSFIQANKTQQSEWGICATMAEFLDDTKIQWSGYVTPNWNSFRLRFTSFNGKANTSDWGRVPCPP